jgi:hypothetical protein
MAGNVANIKSCSPHKLRSGLTGNYHAICHYSYNLPLACIVKKGFGEKAFVFTACVEFRFAVFAERIQ